MRWLGRHGLDDRFMLLVMGIMAVGIFLTARVAGVAVYTTRSALTGPAAAT